MSRSVALVTCRALPDGDPDDVVLPAALAAHGMTSSWEIWDDPDVDWAAFDLVLIQIGRAHV